MSPVKLTLADVEEFWALRDRTCNDCPFLRERYEDGQRLVECSIIEDRDTDPAHCPGVA